MHLMRWRAGLCAAPLVFAGPGGEYLDCLMYQDAAGLDPSPRLLWALRGRPVLDVTANPALVHPTHRRTYNPNRAEAKAFPGSCS